MEKKALAVSEPLRSPPQNPLQPPGACRTSPTGSAAPKPTNRPRGASRSRSPPRCVATCLLITPGWGARIPPPAAGGRRQACWEGGGSFPTLACGDASGQAARLRHRRAARSSPGGCCSCPAPGRGWGRRPRAAGPRGGWQGGRGGPPGAQGQRGRQDQSPAAGLPSWVPPLDGGEAAGGGAGRS